MKLTKMQISALADEVIFQLRQPIKLKQEEEEQKFFELHLKLLNDISNNLNAIVHLLNNEKYLKIEKLKIEEEYNLLILKDLLYNKTKRDEISKSVLKNLKKFEYQTKYTSMPSKNDVERAIILEEMSSNNSNDIIKVIINKFTL